MHIFPFSLGLHQLLLRIPDMIKNKYLASHAPQLKAVEEELAKDRNIAAALKGFGGELPGPEPAPSPTGSTVPTPAPARTVATPDYEGCAVPSFDKRVDVSPKPMEEFTTGRTFFSLRSIFSCEPFALHFPTPHQISIYHDCFSGCIAKLLCRTRKCMWARIATMRASGSSTRPVRMSRSQPVSFLGSMLAHSMS